MRKLYIMFVAVFFLISLVTASMIIPVDEKAKENGKAIENSPVITETETGEWQLDRIDFIHYAKPENPGKTPKTDTCYKLMDVKWNNLPVDYTINPLNPQGLSEDFITSAIFTSAETWDLATSSELFNNDYSINYSVVYGVQDYKNAIDFADYPDNGVIAVTSVWYTRVGKQIVEFDQRYNTRFSWGDATIDSSKMDLQNIATHELGHAVGLGDIYSSSCSQITMYGYSTEGETSKGTLEQPDIIGLQKMYGA